MIYLYIALNFGPSWSEVPTTTIHFGPSWSEVEFIKFCIKQPLHLASTWNEMKQPTHNFPTNLREVRCYLLDKLSRGYFRPSRVEVFYFYTICAEVKNQQHENMKSQHLSKRRDNKKAGTQMHTDLTKG